VRTYVEGLASGFQVVGNENNDTNVRPPRQGPRVTIDDMSESADKKRSDPKLAYGRAPKLSGPGDIKDRVHSLERENLKLKAKENLLELEIRKYLLIFK